MSNTRSPSRSSPVLSGQPKIISIPRVPHPPRLQHSPSLPNIWFPQNSSPIMREKEKGEQDSMRRPSAPSSPKNEPPASVAVKEPQLRHVKYASIDPTYRKPQGAKTHTRRRTERDEPHSLLTPPLTPSSSIRTTASSDSATIGVQTNLESNENSTEEILDSDTESSRVLLLENVSRNITVASLEAAIGDAFANVAVEKNTASEATPSSAPREVLKGINPRLHCDEGIVVVVFFDVREAKHARDLVENRRFDAYLKKYIGDRDGGEDQSTGLSARLITLEELFKIIGHSRFLDGIDGTFSLKVQKLHQQDGDDVRTPTEHDARLGIDDQEDATKPKRAHGSTVTRGGINGAILQNVLQSYGSIRFFRFQREETDLHGITSIIYQVEYHDLRDAEASSQELKDQRIFGMRISLTDGEEDAELASEQQGDTEPFPNASTAGETFVGLPIRPAGAHSQIRQPFVYTIGREDTPQQPPTEFVSQTVSLSSHLPSGGGTSPTYFYTTTPFDSSNHSLQVVRHDQAPVHVRGPGFPDSGGRASAMAVAPHHILAQEQQWDTIYRSDCISPCYGHDGICHYCPSGGVPHNVAYNPPFPAQYAFPPPPPTPPVYYPGHIPPQPMITNMINIVPTPSPTMLGYEYMDHQMQLPPHAGGWGYDPAITAVGPGMSAPSPAPFFLREEAAPSRAGGRYPVAYTRSPSAPHVSQNLQRLQLEAPQPNTLQNIYPLPQFSTPSASPSSHLVPLVPTETTLTAQQPGGPTHDHNQLNLEKIISGVDTRTTVMIKNIPNKMSDSDLEAYIGKVCPHRIDFLYLRMDFKNGCNVGYAFVNFIHVEDLLLFAKERLGAKWNMFSSEKVLQMSYANYQGKEALVEKFKNSAIMDERESWRPRIFFSAGPNKGYPEPFPAPTHIRRKERSSYNRGTLFPPGINSHNMASHSHNTVQNTTRRYHHEDAPLAAPQRGVGGRYQAHGHDREQDGGGESRRGDTRMSTFRTTSNQRATR